MQVLVLHLISQNPLKARLGEDENMNDKNMSKPVAWMYEWAGCITCEGPQDWRVEITTEAPPYWAVKEGQCRKVKALFSREYEPDRETMNKVECMQSLLATLEARLVTLEVWLGED